MTGCRRRSVTARRPRPEVRAGLTAGSGLLAVGPAAAGPDQAVALAVLVLEEVGVDGRREARIVELEREVVAAFVGALRPGGPDLGAADKDPVAGNVVVDPVGLGDDADALGLDAQGDDLALQLAADLLERTDVRHVTSPLAVSSPRPPRPRWRSESRRRSTTHPLAGRSGAEDGAGETLLPREEWAQPRGRKSIRRRCGSGDRGAAALWPDRAGERPCGSRDRTASSGEDVADFGCPSQTAQRGRRRERNYGVREGVRLR